MFLKPKSIDNSHFGAAPDIFGSSTMGLPLQFCAGNEGKSMWNVLQFPPTYIVRESADQEKQLGLIKY